MEQQVSREEVKRLLELLRSQAAEERLRAATELKSMGVNARGAVRTRGAVTQPAARPLEEIDLTPAMEALSDAQWDVRREVALAVGEWGDKLAIEVLERLARTDSEWRVRATVAEALANIGGPKAVENLTYMVKKDPHPNPVERAMEGLGDLALATWPDSLGPAAPERSGAVRTRGGAVRTQRQGRVRGTSPSGRVNPEADAILDLLDEVRFRDPSPSVREAADATLARLDE
jgi:HEAT repeat protein